MTALIATELWKVRLTRTTWGFVAAAVVLSLVRMALVVTGAGTAAGVDRGSTEATLTMVGAAAFGTLALLLFGVTAVSGEFRHATITATLLSTPRRRSVVAAKAIAYAAVGGLVGVALAGLSLVTAMVTGLAGPVDADVLHALLATVLGAVVMTLFGVGTGLLIHNQTIAMVVPLVWLLVVEPMTRSYGLHALYPWLPGTLPGELGPWRAPGMLSPWLAALVLTAYLLAMGLFGARRLERADIG